MNKQNYHNLPVLYSGVTGRLPGTRASCGLAKILSYIFILYSIKLFSISSKWPQFAPTYPYSGKNLFIGPGPSLPHKVKSVKFSHGSVHCALLNSFLYGVDWWHHDHYACNSTELTRNSTPELSSGTGISLNVEILQFFLSSTTTLNI